MPTKKRGRFKVFESAITGVQAVAAATDHHFSRHTHDQYGLGVIESGGHISASGRGQVEAGSGDTITVNPGEVHDGIPVGDHGRSWRMLYFDPGLIAEVVADICEGKGAAFEFTDPVMRSQRNGALFRPLFAAVTGEEPVNCFHELLLGLLGDMIGEKAETAAPAAVAVALERLNDDPAAPVTLSELATLSGLSQFQLLRAVSRITGLTPHAYLIQQRVSMARRLIAGGTPLAQAAAESGFSDQSHMTRMFVRSFGLSPRAYADAVGSSSKREKARPLQQV